MAASFRSVELLLTWLELSPLDQARVPAINLSEIVEVWGNGLAMLDIVSVASDIAAAGTALAGLILVYLGAVAVRYETLDRTEQASTRDDYRGHARRAFRGLVIALVAAIAALTAKSLKAEPYATMIAAAAGLALLISFFIAVMAAYWILESLD